MVPVLGVVVDADVLNIVHEFVESHPEISIVACRMTKLCLDICTHGAIFIFSFESFDAPWVAHLDQFISIFERMDSDERVCMALHQAILGSASSACCTDLHQIVFEVVFRENFPNVINISI